MIDRPVLDHVTRLVTDPGAGLGRLARFIRFQSQLWRFCARRLRDNNLMAMSAALSFRAIFALIPALVLAFLVARAIGTIESSKLSLRHVLIGSGLANIEVPQDAFSSTAGVAEGSSASPEKMVTVADAIESVVERAESKLTFRVLGPIGGALFVWTALTLLTTMERCLNRIFCAPRSRSLPRRVLLYWSVMTLGPVALAIASYLGRQMVQTFESLPGLAWLMVGVGQAGPILVGIVVLGAVYHLLPNTIVDWKAALGGAAVGVLMWMVAKWGFSLYVKRVVVQQQSLYGMLGIFPLFMLWLNLSWTIFLFGAELAHAAANLESVRSIEIDDMNVIAPADAIAVALAVAQPFEQGQGPVTCDEVARRARLPYESVSCLLQRLEDRGIVCAVNGHRSARFALARPPDKVQVVELLEIAEPAAATLHGGNGSGDIGRILIDVDRRMKSPLAGTTLAALLARDVKSELRDGQCT